MQVAAKSLACRDNLYAKVYEAHRQLVKAGLPLTAEAIKNKFLGKVEKGRTLVEVFSEHNNRVAALVGDEFAPGTMERYTTSLKHTQKFMKWKYGVEDIGDQGDQRCLCHSLRAIPQKRAQVLQQHGR